MSSTPVRLAGVHPNAEFDLSGASGLYDRARPSYPLELVERMVNTLSNKPAEVYELGAGTGIFTRLLLALPDKVKSIKCFEPSEGMRTGFKQAVIDKLPKDGPIQVSVAPGTFTDIDAPDSSADLLVVAQAFHWIGRDPQSHEAAMAEFARVLRPGGVLALIWNLEQWQEPGWPQKALKLIEGPERDSDSPQYRLGYWRPIFETPSYKQHFRSPYDANVGHDLKTVHRSETVTAQGLIDRILSKSYMSRLPQSQQEQFAQDMRAVLKEEADKSVAWVDRDAGTFEQPFATDLFLFQKL